MWNHNFHETLSKTTNKKITCLHKISHTQIVYALSINNKQIEQKRNIHLWTQIWVSWQEFNEKWWKRKELYLEEQHHNHHTDKLHIRWPQGGDFHIWGSELIALLLDFQTFLLKLTKIAFIFEEIIGLVEYARESIDRFCGFLQEQQKRFWFENLWVKWGETKEKSYMDRKEKYRSFVKFEKNSKGKRGKEKTIKIKSSSALRVYFLYFILQSLVVAKFM